MTEARDRIRLSGITATGHHGVFEHERRDGQTFVADVVLHVDTRPAAAQDRLDLTVDYGVLADQVAGVLEGDPADLLETVAERIAAVALTHRGVEAVEVVVHKPQAPIEVPFGDVTVEVRRDRTHAPAVVAPPVAVVAPPVASAPVVSAPPAGPEPTPQDARPSAPVATARLDAPLHAPLVAPLVAPLDAPLDAPPDPTATTAPRPALHAADPESTAMFTAIDPEHPEHVPAEVPQTTSAVPPEEPRDRLDEVPAEPVDVVIALGSNLGPSQETLRRAVYDLAAVDGLEVTDIAPLARSAAVGGPAQADFLNTVVLGRTRLSPRALLHACQAVEAAHGRERHEHWGPRTLDVDLVVHGGTVASAEDLELPHPRAHERAFVLQPWAQVDPDAVLPGLGGGPVAALAGTAPDRDGIRWMALDWWKAPEPGAEAGT